MKVPVSSFKFYLLFQEAFQAPSTREFFAFYLSSLTTGTILNCIFFPLLGCEHLKGEKNKVWPFFGPSVLTAHILLNGPFLYHLFSISVFLLIFHYLIFSTFSAICVSYKTVCLSLGCFLVSTLHLCPA